MLMYCNFASKLLANLLSDSFERIASLVYKIVVFIAHDWMSLCAAATRVIESEAMKPAYRLASSEGGVAETGRYINYAVSRSCTACDVCERLAERVAVLLCQSVSSELLWLTGA